MSAPAINLIGEIIKIGIESIHLPKSPSSATRTVSIHCSQGATCVTKITTLSSKNEKLPEKMSQPAEAIISNWMTLPILEIQNIVRRNLRMVSPTNLYQLHAYHRLLIWRAYIMRHIATCNPLFLRLFRRLCLFNFPGFIRHAG